MKRFTLLFIILIIALNVNSQIKIFSSGAISVGALTDPGSEITKFYDPVVFSQSVIFSGSNSFSTDIMPSTTGLNLGSTSSRWNFLYLSGSANISGNANVTGNANITGTSTFTGASQFHSNANFSNGIIVSNTCQLDGPTDINGGLDAVGNIYFHNSPSASGSVSFGGSVSLNPVKSGAAFVSNIPSTINGVFNMNGTMTLQGVFYNYSDSVLKVNIEPLHENSLNKILNIRGVTYEFKDDINKEKRTGFIAQEFQKEFPELVAEQKKGLAINTLDLLPHLVEAIKEQNKIINNLEERIVNLEEIINYSNLKKLATITTDIESPNEPILYQNNPNPFSSNTIIKFNLPDQLKSAFINIYKMNGIQLKSILVSDNIESQIQIPGGEFQPGIYLYTLIIDHQIIDTKQMIITD